MKFAIIAVAAFLLISSVYGAAAPELTTTTGKPCLQDQCPLEYKPVCGGPEGTTNNRERKSFGNICVMNKYNCEKETNLVKLLDGECPGGGAVRLA